MLQAYIWLGQTNNEGHIMLNSTDIKQWLDKRSLKEHNQQATRLLVERYGSLHKGLEAVVETSIPRSANAESSHNFIAVYKNDDPTESFGLKDKTTQKYNSSFKGDILSCIGFFYGIDKEERGFEGSKIIAEHFKIPTWLLSYEQRDLAIGFLLNKYGTLRSAGESLSNMTLYNCPTKTGQNWESTKGYRLLENDDSFAVIHLTDGNCAPKANFFANLGAVLGYRDKAADDKGWEVVTDDIIGSPTNITIDPQAVSRAKASARQREEELVKKNNLALERAKDILSQAVCGDEAKEVYASYLKHDRNLEGIVAEELSEQVLLVKELQYFNQNDKDNHKKTFTAIILPLVKKQDIHALHVIYLENIDGKWRKANVLTAKKDLASWSLEQGSSCTISRHDDAKTVYLGEGNENVSSYLGAIRVRYGKKPIADFKCTNTATRLSGYDSSDDKYESYNILVDRDFSGAGMKHSMIKRHQLQAQGKEANFIIPPSLKLPIFIYPAENNEALTLEKCLEEAEYWNAVDYVFRERSHNANRTYKSRYKSLVVVTENQMKTLSDDQKDTAILKSELDKANYPKGVDWSDLLAVNSAIAFELTDLYDSLVKECA